MLCYDISHQAICLVSAGFDAGVVIQDKQTEIKAKLTNIEVLDPEPTTLYPRVSFKTHTCMQIPYD